jgi:hypothetical protein
MRFRGTLVTVAVLAAALVGGAGSAGAMQVAGASTAAAAPYCGITWGSLGKSSGALSQAPLIETRTGRHDCYDRVVFEFNGPADGYAIRYGEAYTEGQGRPMSPFTAGGALLAVTLRAPAYTVLERSRYPHRTGDHVAEVRGYRTLRDVVFGGSFEGYTTFAVGVRARLPFRVFVLPGPGRHSRIVLDVAHRWQA